jgi:hypothetical protein
MRLEDQTQTPPVEPGSTTGECAAHQPIDTLIHLGAGQCSELDSYLALKAGKIVLIEADPMLAAALQARTASLPNVRVMCNAVAGSAGPAVFYRYNLPGTGSLRPATGLLQLFPGLKPLDQMPIEAVLPATVLEPLQLRLRVRSCSLLICLAKSCRYCKHCGKRHNYNCLVRSSCVVVVSRFTKAANPQHGYCAGWRCMGSICCRKMTAKIPIVPAGHCSAMLCNYATWIWRSSWPIYSGS